MGGRRKESTRSTGARSEQNDAVCARDASANRPFHRTRQPTREQWNIKAEPRIDVVSDPFVVEQEVDAQRRPSGLSEPTSQIPVAIAVAGAAAAVREDDEAGWMSVRQPEIADQ